MSIHYRIDENGDVQWTIICGEEAAKYWKDVFNNPDKYSDEEE